MFLLRWLISAVLLSTFSLSDADELIMSALLEVDKAFFNLPVPGSDIAAGYMQLKNAGQQDDVVIKEYNSSQVRVIELHENVHANGMMRMRRIKQLHIKPNNELILSSGGYHLMLFGLQKGLAESDSITVELVFSDESTKKVKLTARALR